ncbi:hypothetical protein [Burkholderia sp. BE17]|uniref:hypothetical protein n=1 Tax=Burkholderia sp. BE17 TaxID=2656644 RepID=UPI00187B765A|nr:hypothetical protein [Burkholderia sp. BE17]
MNQQTDTSAKPRGRRPAASLAERIAEAERHLAGLREQQKREEKENLEKNRKAILDLFRSERLDVIPVERWKELVPQLKALVGDGSPSGSDATGSDQRAANEAGAAAQAA